MKDIKRSYKVYAAWEYEKEEEDLNKASKEGWQLVKGGCFNSIFRKDHSIQYIYQLDYMPNAHDKYRYKEIFEEQGWEYINSTFNGWNYFRKSYKEGDNIEDYKIYTDKESLYEMQNRWIKFSSILFFFYMIFSGIYVVNYIRTKEFSWLIYTIVFVLLTATFGLGVRNLRRRRKGLKNGINLSIGIIFPIAIILLIGTMGLSASKSHNVVYHTNFTDIRNPQEALLKLTDTITIEKTDKYKLDLEVAISDGQLEIVIEDVNKNKVFDVAADQCIINNHEMLLEAGTYYIHFNQLNEKNTLNPTEMSLNIQLKK